MQPRNVNMFYFLELLAGYSDVDHILATNEIIEMMLEKYQVKIERRTVYSYINTLMFFGFDISTYDDNGKGYYLRSIYFNEAEIRMLIHGLYLDPECGRSDARNISEKLQKFLSVYKRRQYGYLAEKKKLTAAFSAEQTELLLKAYEEGKRISFGYSEYVFENDRVCEKKNRCETDVLGVEPKGGMFYAECDICGEKRHIGAELMHDISLTDEPAQNGAGASADEPLKVIVKCRDEAINDIMHDFVNRVRILTHKNNSFTAVIDMDRESVLPWALKNLALCEVLEPKELRERIIGAIKNSGYCAGSGM